MNPGILKLFAWSRDFSPNTQQQTTTQVWLRIYGLSQEYWRKKILFAIASSVGTPICTDAITSKPRIERSFGHFARVLVDIDLSQELRYRVLVERKGYAFFVDFEYENLPDFCTHCNCTGHSIDICKRLKDNKGKQTMAQPVKPRQEFVPKTKAAEVNQVATRSERSKEDVDLEYEINDELAQDEIVPIVHDVDQNIEKEGNESAAFVAVEDNSTDGSEFVEATQQNFEDDSTSKSDASQHVPVVQSDMEFLKKSWANLADLEAEVSTPAVQVSLLERMQQVPILIPVAETDNVNVESSNSHNIDKDGFQKVLSKSGKKQQKSTTVRSNYPTRSRVGTSKSLK